MKKIVSIILIVISFFMIGIAIVINLTQNNVENTLKKYCNEIYGDLVEADGKFTLSVASMKERYGKDIKVFENKKCNLKQTYVEAHVEGNKLICENTIKCEE